MYSRNLSVLDFVKCFLLAAKASAEKTPRVHLSSVHFSLIFLLLLALILPLHILFYIFLLS